MWYIIKTYLKYFPMKKKTATKASKKAQWGDMLIVEKLPGYFLLVCLLTVFAYMLYILRPFLTVIFVAGVLTISFYPVYRKISQWLRGWNRLASFLSCLLVLILIVAPVAAFIVLITDEAFETYVLIQDKINSGVFDRYLQWSSGGVIYDLLSEVQDYVDLSSINLKENIVNIAQSLSSFLAAQTTLIARGISEIGLGVMVMLFTMFYFFKDGEQLVDKMGMLSPLPKIYESELFGQVSSMVKAVVFGVFLTAIIQGLVGGIGFAIAGVSSPVFWGTAMAFFSLVPMVGTAIIWVPAVVILAILGNYGAALFIFIWGVFAVGSVDNIARPYLIGGKAHTYPLMTFLVVLGGVMTMGLKGVIVGPLVLIILMSFLHIYESEYKRVLKK